MFLSSPTFIQKENNLFYVFPSTSLLCSMDHFTNPLDIQITRFTRVKSFTSSSSSTLLCAFPFQYRTPLIESLSTHLSSKHPPVHKDPPGPVRPPLKKDSTSHPKQRPPSPGHRSSTSNLASRQDSNRSALLSRNSSHPSSQSKLPQLNSSRPPSAKDSSLSLKNSSLSTSSSLTPGSSTPLVHSWIDVVSNFKNFDPDYFTKVKDSPSRSPGRKKGKKRK